MNLNDALKDAWDGNPDATSGEIAAVVMGSVRSREELFELVFPAVVAQATVVKRQRVRQVESAAFSHGGVDNQFGSADVAGFADDPDYIDPITARREMLRDRAYVNHDIGYVLWGEMTAEQHTIRADYLERKAHGHLVTADRHRTAAKFIEEAGVSCLNDLPALPDELFEGVTA
jgi:hypothetical protein